jgi:hypothetical protein
VTTLDDVRRFATALPAVEETVHFRFKQPVFKVVGTTFAGGGGSKGEGTAVFCIPHAEAAAAVAADPDVYEEVWRPGARRSFIGVRVDLAKVSHARLEQLVYSVWRHKAPKRLAAAPPG